LDGREIIPDISRYGPRHVVPPSLALPPRGLCQGAISTTTPPISRLCRNGPAASASATRDHRTTSHALHQIISGAFTVLRIGDILVGSQVGATPAQLVEGLQRQVSSILSLGSVGVDGSAAHEYRLVLRADGLVKAVAESGGTLETLGKDHRFHLGRRSSPPGQVVHHDRLE
jgi:hypothetical protein